MDPAPGKCDIRIFPIQLPVSGIAVTDNYARVTFQKFSRMVCFSGPLIFIQDDRRIEYSGRFYTPIPEIGNHRSDMKETAIPF